MEGWSRRSGGIVELWCIITFLALTFAVSVYGDQRIMVGGAQMWNPNVNYTKWSANQHFYVGYWLYFVYDKRYYSVLEVNKTGYERCSTDHLIGNFTGGAGRDVVLLNESRPYYFITGGGYCWNGMKLSVLVEENPPVPALAPTNNASPPSRSLCWVLVTIVVAWTSSFFIFSDI
ncbi:lamin-like protein [Telopea speciosissima]|uniref:lamin-like protein n=1 Tax=Telopea speciosissima TaxID=54955 RepID=UPI001CC70469|nr:lamin-like protein [Telopea speciosissima]